MRGPRDPQTVLALRSNLRLTLILTLKTVEVDGMGGMSRLRFEGVPGQNEFPSQFGRINDSL